MFSKLIIRFKNTSKIVSFNPYTEALRSKLYLPCYLNKIPKNYMSNDANNNQNNDVDNEKPKSDNIDPQKTEIKMFGNKDKKFNKHFKKDQQRKSNIREPHEEAEAKSNLVNSINTNDVQDNVTHEEERIPQKGLFSRTDRKDKKNKFQKIIKEQSQEGEKIKPAPVEQETKMRTLFGGDREKSTRSYDERRGSASDMKKETLESAQDFKKNLKSQIKTEEDPKKLLFKEQKSKKFTSTGIMSPGYILKNLGLDTLPSDEVGLTEEVVSEQHINLIKKRIANVEKLEDVPKKYEELIELYYSMNDYNKVEYIYNTQYKNMKHKRTESIDNIMFQSCMKLSYEKALRFFNDLIKNNRLTYIYKYNMHEFINLQIDHDNYIQVNNTFKILKNHNYSLNDINASIFKKLLNIKDYEILFTINDDPYANYNDIQVKATNITDMRILNKLNEFIYKSEMIVELLCEILPKKTTVKLQQIQNFYDFSEFFKSLNNVVNNNMIKLNSKGEDLLLSYIDLLCSNSLLQSEYVAPQDLASWMRLYFNKNESLSKLMYIINNANFENNDVFFEEFHRLYNQYIADNNRIPFDAQNVVLVYNALKNTALNSQFKLSPLTTKVFLELALSHRLYDITFDIYEKYSLLTRNKNISGFVYVYMMNNFTTMLLKSSSQEAKSTTNIDIIKQLIEECKAQEVDGLSPSIINFFRVKALILDKNYNEAYDIFMKDIINPYIIEYQKVLILGMILKLHLKDKKRMPYRKEKHIIAKMKDMVMSLTDEEVIDIYNKTHNSSYYISGLTGHKELEFVIDFWRMFMRDPELYARVLFKDERQRELEENQEKITFYESPDGTYQVRHSEEDIKLANEWGDLIRKKFEEAAENDMESDITVVSIKFDLFDLNKGTLQDLLQNQPAFEQVKNLIRIPLENPNAQKILKQFKEINKEGKLYDTPITQLLFDLALWGIQKNEPLAVDLATHFFNVTGYEPPVYIQNQIMLYRRYQLTGRIPTNEASTSFSDSIFTKAERTFISTSGLRQYEQIESTPFLDDYILGLQANPSTYDLYERTARKYSCFKADALRLRPKPIQNAIDKLEESKEKKLPNYLSA